MEEDKTAQAVAHEAYRFLGVANDCTEYSFTIPHDMQTLIEFMGGPEAF